jgi:hypothetical protein
MDYSIDQGPDDYGNLGVLKVWGKKISQVFSNFGWLLSLNRHIAHELQSYYSVRSNSLTLVKLGSIEKLDVQFIARC